MILDGHANDKYVTTHLYGAVPDASLAVDDVEVIDLLKEQSNEKANENSFQTRAKLTENEMHKVKKMTSFETYIALLKGYCSISILLLPKAFLHGGWLASAAFELGAAIITTICVMKLVQVGLKLNLYSY